MPPKKKVEPTINPDPADVTLFDEDDDPESNIGEEVND